MAYIYFIVDTIFVGQFAGTLGVTPIMAIIPITFFISPLGMAIGVNESSVMLRALGNEKRDKTKLTSSNMISWPLLTLFWVVALGSILDEEILFTFGGQGDILKPAKSCFSILLYGIPCLDWVMMLNNGMQAEGEPRVAMLTMAISAIAKILIYPILIIWHDMGLEG